LNNRVFQLKALRLGGIILGKETKAELVGSEKAMKYIQDEKGLLVMPDGIVHSLTGISNQLLSDRYRVLRISHDRGWFNGDDPGVEAPGWFRYANIGMGDFSNDLTINETPGDSWSCPFSGNCISVVAPKEAGVGKMEIVIDGKRRAIVDLSTVGDRKPQQIVYEENNLPSAKHTIKIVNRG
jgi:hypothetical protein